MEDEHFVQAHAAIGSQLVSALPLSGVSDLVKYHHEHLDGSGPFALVGEGIPIGARILSLADTIDNALVTHRQTRAMVGQVCEVIERGCGQLFDSDMCDLWRELAKQESFWLDLSERNLSLALSRLQPNSLHLVNSQELKAIAGVFSEIIDCKSRFTQYHSQGLAERIRVVALTDARLAPNAELLYVAALLHDVGKLAVPNAILEKPSQLTPEEYAVVRAHVYYTKLVLRQVKGLETLAEWAGNHHERIDGRGYADRLPASKLGLEDRLMAVCDVYQALVEERPYRAGMSSRHAVEVIESMVKSGGLCAEATRLLAALV